MAHAKARPSAGFMNRARWELACKACGRTWPEETPLATVRQHMREEHDRNDVALLLQRRIVN